MGGGGSSDASKFKAQGNPPGYDYQTSQGLQQLAIGGDIQGYSLSDQDFANRYPELQKSYDQWQANLGQQTGQVQQGYNAQSDIMGGLANTIAGRQGTETTGDINKIRSSADTAASAVDPIYGLGKSQAGLAQGLVNMGQQQAGLGQKQAGLYDPLMGMAGQQQNIGNQINQTGQMMTGWAQTPYNTGQELLNTAIDPQVQQEMMRAGLTSAAGSLGNASLGSGMAGQAAAARQLGLSTVQYGQQRRAEAMGDIGLASSIAGQGGQMQGLGGQTINAAGQTAGLAGSQLAQGAASIGAGGQTVGLGGQQMNQAAQTYGLGANTAAQAGGLYGQAQQAQEQYGMDTAQMSQIYGGMQQQQAQNLLGSIASSGQLFQKRPFGLGGANMAQTELGQAGAYNSFQQANYATMNGIAYNQSQMSAQQDQLKAQQSAGMMSAGVGAAGAVASAAAAAAAITCWVARECLGTKDSRWKEFRIWMLNFAPSSFRQLYLRHGEAFAESLKTRPALKALIRRKMLRILETQRPFLALNTLLTA